MSACTRPITGSLDKRRRASRSELDEAAKLKSEAQALLAEYKQKTANAENEAAAIIEGAKADAERLAAEAHAKLEDFVARRTKMAETKIAQAEQQALAEVRSVAAEAAVGAAEKVLARAAKGAVGGAIDRPRHRRRQKEAELTAASVFAPALRTSTSVGICPGAMPTQFLCTTICRSKRRVCACLALSP